MRASVRLVLVILAALALLGAVWLVLVRGGAGLTLAELDSAENLPEPGSRVRAVPSSAAEPRAPETAAVESPGAGAAPSEASDLLLTAELEMADESRVPAAEGEIAGPLHRLEGVVVDERTDEPVPHVDVTLDAGGAAETLRTDERGRFRAERGAPAGPLAITLADGGALVAHLEHELTPGAPTVTLRVPIGPTIPVLIDDAARPSAAAHLDDAARPGGATHLDAVARPDGADLERYPPDTWRARLVETARPADEAAGAIEITPAGQVRMPPVEREPRDRVWPWRRLRPGERPWLRYARAHHEPDPRLRVVLELGSVAASRAGTAEVDGTVGVRHPVRVAVTEVALATVTGQVATSGARLPWRLRQDGAAVVLLVPPSPLRAPSDPPPIWHEASLPAHGGDFALEGVAAGRWKLVVHAPAHVVHVAELDLAPGTTRLGRIELRHGEHTDLELFWRPKSVPLPPDERWYLRLRLRAAAPFGRAWLVGASWGRPTDPVRSAHEYGLPEGVYDLEPVAVGGPPRFRPYELMLEAPVESETLLVPIDPAESLPFRFEVRDAETAEPVPRFSVRFGPRGSVGYRASATEHTTWTFPPDAPLHWAVWTDDRAPAFGTAADFEPREDGRVARIELRAGWGVELLVRAGDPTTFASDPYPWSRMMGWPLASASVGALAAAPIPGVEVYEGDRLLGRSDEHGAIRLALDHQPTRLVLRAPGWRLVDATWWGYGGAAPILWMVRR